MGVFDKFFGRKKQKSPREEIPRQEMTPLEAFVKRFTDNGGLFLLAEQTDDVYAYLRQILKEEDKENYIIYDDAVLDMPRKAGLPYSSSHSIDPEKDVFFSPVMYLIQNTGGIMISANQTQGIPWEQLPSVLVFTATPAQLAEDTHEALSDINRRFRQHYPEQLKTYTRFNAEEKAGKKVYLILHYE